MRASDYQVAVPSYHRADTCARWTLPLLHARNVPADRVTVFVADEPEARRYRSVLPADTYREITVACPGMGAVRNWINHYYPADTQLVQVDDDVRNVIARTGPNASVPTDDLHTLFTEMFGHLRETGLTLWGVYPVANAYFMRHTLSTDLRYIVGALWGVINQPGAEHCQVTLDDKEDFERTIRHYLHAGGVLRRNDVAVDTRYYSEPGGMQVERTDQRVAESARALVRRYPQLCSLNTAKRSKHVEVKLRDRTRRKAPAIATA